MHPAGYFAQWVMHPAGYFAQWVTDNPAGPWGPRPCETPATGPRVEGGGGRVAWVARGPWGPVAMLGPGAGGRGAGRGWGPHAVAVFL